MIRKFKGIEDEHAYRCVLAARPEQKKLDLKDIIEKWKKECQNRETIGVHICGDRLFITTRRPGLMIGYHGKLVEKYKILLKDNGYPCDVEFVDLFCGGIRIF